MCGVSGRFLEGECGRAVNKPGDFLPPASVSSSGKSQYSYNWWGLSLRINQLMGVKPVPGVMGWCSVTRAVVITVITAVLVINLVTVP